MADKETLAAALAGLSLEDLRVDADGRVHIANPDIAKKVSDAVGGVGARALSDSLNTGTCNNKGCLAPEFDPARRIR